MKCMACGKRPVETRRESHRYTECGLDFVTLLNVQVRHCTHCGETEYVVPNVEQLHSLIASIVAAKPERLVPSEIRFLRKYLGYSSVDFAKAIGVAPETVSRWENVYAPKLMTLGLERFLRLMVMYQKPATSYAPLPKVEDTATKAPAPARLKVKATDHSWRRDEAR